MKLSPSVPPLIDAQHTIAYRNIFLAAVSVVVGVVSLCFPNGTVLPHAVILPAVFVGITTNAILWGRAHRKIRSLKAMQATLAECEREGDYESDVYLDAKQQYVEYTRRELHSTEEPRGLWGKMLAAFASKLGAH